MCPELYSFASIALTEKEVVCPILCVVDKPEECCYRWVQTVAIVGA